MNELLWNYKGSYNLYLLDFDGVIFAKARYVGIPCKLFHKVYLADSVFFSESCDVEGWLDIFLHNDSYHS
jgi:hypothetical protein